LSGYVLAYNYFPEAKPIDAKKFWWLRFARIYPLYLLAFALSTPAAVAAISKGYGAGAVLLKSAMFATAALTMIHAWHPSTAMGWNVPSWSVSVETFFYLTFPFVGYWVARLARPAALAIAMLIAAAALPLVLIPLGVSPRILYYNPLAHFPYFVLGIALHRINLPNSLRRGANWAVLATLAFLAISYFVDRNVVGAFNAPVFAWLILALSSGEGAAAKFLAWSPIVFLGEVSFGVYLLQDPVMHALLAVLGWEEWRATWPLVALYVTLLILISSASFLWFETPTRRWLRKITAKPSPVAVPA
jgi:peptidoglycan/LPS O-acetylase OafA/YrhL